MKLLAARGTTVHAQGSRVLAEKKIECEVQIVDVVPSDNPVNPHNPLGKIPTLVLDDGTALYDSRVIVEFLEQRLADQPRLIPIHPRPRRGAPLEALADGVLDAGLLCATSRCATKKAAEERAGRTSSSRA